MTYHGWDWSTISMLADGSSETVWGPPLWIPYLCDATRFGLFALQLLADLIEILADPAEDIVMKGGPLMDPVLAGALSRR